MADPTNQFAGLLTGDFQPTDASGNVIVKKAEPVKQSQLDVLPDMDKHDPVTYGNLTAAQALAQRHAEHLDMNLEEYDALAKDATGKAMEYQAHQKQTLYEKGLAEGQKLAEVQPGGYEQQKAAIEAQSAQKQKQEEQGPGATAQAIQEGVFPGQSKSGVSAVIKNPEPAQQKDWSAYIEGFHNLQTMHQLFDNMATKTFGAGGPFKSAFGLTKPIIDQVSPEARLYNSYVDSSLVPIAKSIMGDAATTAGKDNIQAALQNAFPNATDSGQTGGQKMFNFYQRALDKMQTERNMARKNGIYTGSIDTELNDFQSFFNSPEVQKYNPAKNQPLVNAGTSQTANQQIANGMYKGTGQAPPQLQGNPNQFLGMQASGSGTQLLPTQPSASPAAQQQHAAQAAQAAQIGQGIAQRAGQTNQEVVAGPKTIWDWMQPFQTSPEGNVQFPGQ